MGKTVKKKEYATVAGSSLDNLVKSIELVIIDLEKRLDSEPVTLESRYTKEQFVAFRKAIDIYKSCIPDFDKGAKPFSFATFSAAHPQSITEAYILYNKFPEIHNHIFGILEKELPNMVNACYKALSPKKEETEFKKKLKLAIQEKLKKVNDVIPCNIKIYQEKIDRCINNIDLNEFFPECDSKKLISELVADLKENFVGRKTSPTVKMVHPLFYELSMQILVLLKTIPEELKDFIPFLNPVAVGIVPFLEPKSSDKYIYFQKNWKEEIDLAVYYKDGKQVINDSFANTITQYLIEYADTPHAKNELAKTKQIIAFMREEKRVFSAEADDIVRVKKIVDSNSHPLEFSQVLEQLEKQKLAIEKLISEIDSRLDDYKSKTFAELASKHEIKYPEASHHNCKLPEILLTVEGIDYPIEILTADLTEIKNQLKNKLHQLEKDAILDHHENVKNIIVDKLHELNKTLQKIVEQRYKEGITGEELFNERANSLLAIHTEYNELQVLVEKKDCPDHLRKELQSLINAIYSKARNGCYQLKLDILVIQKQLEKEKVFIEKNKAAKAFQESMKSTDLNTLSTLLEKKREELHASIALEEKLKNELSELALKTQGIEHSHDDSVAKETCTDKIIKLQSKAHQKRASILAFSTTQTYDELFKIENLESVDGIKDALTFMSSLVSVGNELKKNKKTIDDQILSIEHKRSVLTTVVNTIESYAEKTNKNAITKLGARINSKLSQIVDSSSKIIKEINKLPALNVDALKKHYQLNGENIGLQVLAKILNKDVSDLKNLSSDTLKDQLNQEIKNCVQELKELRDKHEKISHYESSDCQSLIRDINEIINLTNEVYFQEKRMDLSKSQDLTKKLEAEVAIQAAIISLLQENQSLNIMLNDENIDFTNLRSDKAEALLETCIKEFKCLKDSVAKFSGEKSYQQSVELIGGLQLTALKRIAAIKIERITEKLNGIISSEKQFDSYSDELINLQERLIALDNLQKLIPQEFSSLYRLHAQLIDSEYDLAENIELQISKTRNALIQQIELMLGKFQTELNEQLQLLKIDLDDSKEICKLHEERIAKLNIYLEDMNNLDGLNKALGTRTLSTVSVSAVVTQQEQLKIELAKHRKILSGQVERKQKRESLEAAFITKSTEYLINRAKKYRIKDFITSQDCENRTNFINELRDILKNYVSTGNCQPVLKYIEENRSQFYGFTLQSMISRVIIEIKGIEKLTPTNQENYISEERKDPCAEHAKAKAGLEQIQNEQIKNALRSLCEKIESFKNYGKNLAEVDKLTNGLREQADELILLQANGDVASQTRSKELYTEMKEYLHSQDDVMSKHNSFWKPFLINFTAAFVTLGIALGIKLAVSKIHVGHASFFGTAERLQRVQDLDIAISNVVTAAGA